MNGIYWGLTALALLGHKDALPRDEMLKWVMSCWNREVGASITNHVVENTVSSPLAPVYTPPAGAFAPHPGHDPHLHPTLSAIQILAIHDALDLIDKDKVVACEWQCSQSLRPDRDLS